MRGGSGAARWFASQLGLAAVCLALPVRADPPPGQPFRLEYWARGECPDATEFAREIQSRAPHLRPAEGDEPALGFYAELDARGGSALGRLTARSPDGREVRREVHGATCDDVTLALALIAALAADPTQPVEASPPPQLRQPRRRAPKLAEAPVDDRPDLPELRASAEQSAPRWTFGVGGGLEFNSSIAPSPGSGLSVVFEAEGPPDSAFRPFWSLSANRAAAASTPTSGGDAAFTWLAFRLNACPLRWPEQTPLFMRPCAFFDAGELTGSVSFEGQSKDSTQAWFALGAFGRLEALVGEVVSLQLDGGLSVPLRHDEFRAGEGAPSAFNVPSSGILGRIGLSYRFQ